MPVKTPNGTTYYSRWEKLATKLQKENRITNVSSKNIDEKYEAAVRKINQDAELKFIKTRQTTNNIWVG